MPRVEIPVQELAAFGGTDADVAWTAGDAGNGHYFLNDGKCILLMQSSAGGKTATIVSVPDQYGRSGDKTLAPAAGKTGSAGVFPPALFNQQGASDLGKVFLNLDNATGVTFALVKFNP